MVFMNNNRLTIKHNPGSLWRALPTNRPILSRTQAPNSSPHTPSSASPVEHPALVTKEVTSVTTMGRHLLNHPPPPRPIAHKLARHSKERHSADPESGELAHNRHTHKPPELLHPVAICLLLGACTKVPPRLPSPLSRRCLDAVMHIRRALTMCTKDQSAHLTVGHQPVHHRCRWSCIELCI